MKEVFKDGLFVIIFIFLFIICSNIFVLKGNYYGSDVISFYNLKKNSLDIIFLGSSHSYASFSPDIIFKDTNLKSYNFATQQQPIYITYHYMKETLKTQKPKYFVLETFMLTNDLEYTKEGVNRDAIDKMKLSLNKIKAIQASVKDKDERLSYYINIIKYHSRYDELTLKDIKDGILYRGIDNKGYIELTQNYDVFVNNNEVLKINDIEKISDKNLLYLNKMVQLCKDNNIKLILVSAPCKLSMEMQKKYNWLRLYAKLNSLDFIDYNVENINLTPGDFYDTGHLSKSGSIKISNDIKKYFLNK